jgi:hypothetical protein
VSFLCFLSLSLLSIFFHHQPYLCLYPVLFLFPFPFTRSCLSHLKMRFQKHIEVLASLNGFPDCNGKRIVMGGMEICLYYNLISVSTQISYLRLLKTWKADLPTWGHLYNPPLAETWHCLSRLSQGSCSSSAPAWTLWTKKALVSAGIPGAFCPCEPAVTCDVYLEPSIFLPLLIMVCHRRSKHLCLIVWFNWAFIETASNSVAGLETPYDMMLE